jgi:hypothetical protein
MVTVRPAPPGPGHPTRSSACPASLAIPPTASWDHLTVEHGIGHDTGRFIVHAQGVSGLVKEHDLDHTENAADQLGHTHPTPW